MLLNKFLNKNKAQQLIEFAFVIPILILILFVIVEFAYAMNIRIKLSDGAKASLMQVNKLSNLPGSDPDAKKEAVRTAIQANMVAFLTENNVPDPSGASVSINKDTNGFYTVNVTYLYKPVFLLPFIPGMPAIPLQSSQIINSNIMQLNNFNSGLKTKDLSGFFPNPEGALTTPYIEGYNIRDSIAILVNWYDDDYIDLEHVDNPNGFPIHARLFSWYGEDLLPANLRVNVRRATLEVRSPYYKGSNGINGDWLDTQIPYVWVLAALDYSQVFYVKYNASIDVDANGKGWTLNACDKNYYYYGPYICPLKWNNTAYNYLYRINPLDPDLNHRHKFMKSFGYLWCGTLGKPNCDADQSGSGTIQELALEGSAKEWVKDDPLHNFVIKGIGNSENTINIGNKKIDALQHYTVQENGPLSWFTGNRFTINLLQPAA